jgi:hypothetical protein
MSSATIKLFLPRDSRPAAADGFLRFTKATEFTSPGTAAAVIHRREPLGLTEWKTKSGVTLNELDERA